jgi:HAMP domain-containing protein
MPAKFKRKRLWVDPAFQARLLIRMVCYLVLFIVFVFHVSFVFEAMANYASDAMAKGIGGLYVEYLSQQRTFLFSLLLVAPILLYDLLKYSHRVAGPLFRCRRVMQDMAAGKPVPPFVPRQHDLMGELFQAFNGLITEWNRRLATANGHAEAAKDASPDRNGAKLETAGV